MIGRVKRTVDVLVVGAGLAGLRAAAEARRFGADVLLVDKGMIGITGGPRRIIDDFGGLVDERPHHQSTEAPP